MQIRRVLDNKGSEVVTVRPDQDVQALVGLLAQHKVGALVVSPDGRHVAGIVSERDVVRALASMGTSVLTEPVSAIATADVHTVTADRTVDELRALMTEARVRHIPVVDAQHCLVGIVSIGDVVKNHIDALAGERDALQSYVTSGG